MSNYLDILQERFNLTHKEVALIEVAQTFYSKRGGIELGSYWINEKSDNRDEYIFISLLYIMSNTMLFKEYTGKIWKNCFDVFMLTFFTVNFRTIKIIDYAAENRCYADAFILLRSLHSRVNLSTLFSLNPRLIKMWEKNSKENIFLDGKVRGELENQGLTTMPFMYEYYSEVVHGGIISLQEIGNFEGKIDERIEPIRNMIYVSAKLMIGYLIHIMLETEKIATKCNPNARLNTCISLFEKIKDHFFDPFRLDHLWTIVSEERFWKKVGKDTFDCGGGFNMEVYSEKIVKFHREKGQKKVLSKSYNVGEKLIWE